MWLDPCGLYEDDWNGGEDCTDREDWVIREGDSGRANAPDTGASAVRASGRSDGDGMTDGETSEGVVALEFGI